MTLYSILDCQADFLLVHKYPGIAVQGAADGASLVSVVKRDLGLEALFPVHRLDVETSGLVLFARSREANQKLSLAFQNREVDKYYIAVTQRKPSKKQGSVIGDMEKSRNGSYKLLRSRENPSKTSFFSFALVDGFRLIALKPYTGKTHQLRVALKSLSAPIVGDQRYGGIASDRMYLHAYQLQFTLKGRHYSYEQMPQSGELFLCPAFKDRIEQIANLDSLAWAK